MNADLIVAEALEGLVLSEWLGPDESPPSVGVWLTRTAGHVTGEGFQYWTGDNWGMFSVSPDEAFADRDAYSAFQDNEWRGLAADPSGGAK